MVLLRTAFAFCLTTTLALAQVPYGDATPGSGGFAPSLTADQPYVGNAAFSYHLDGGLGGAPALMLISTARDSRFLAGTEILVSLLPGEHLLTLPFALAGTPGVPGEGSAMFNGGLGNAQPAVVGLNLFLQVAILDPAPVGRRFSATRVLRRRPGSGRTGRRLGQSDFRGRTRAGRGRGHGDDRSSVGTLRHGTDAGASDRGGF